MFQRLCRGAVLVAIGICIMQAQANQNGAPATMTYRQWKQLRGRAHTAEEYRSLARWAQSQVEFCHRKQLQYEAELRDYYAKSGPQAVPKQNYDHQLKVQVAHSIDQQRHWNDTAKLYFQKAADAEAKP